MPVDYKNDLEMIRGCCAELLMNIDDSDVTEYTARIMQLADIIEYKCISMDEQMKRISTLKKNLDI